MPLPQIIAMLWMPALGIAVERAVSPELNRTPLVLVDASDRVVVASDEAAEHGIKQGQRLAGARALCPQLAVRPLNPELYSAAAEPAWNHLATETDDVQPVGYAQCYAKLDGRDLEPRLDAVFRHIASRMQCAVYMGAGRTKLLARLAAEERREMPCIAAPVLETALLRRARLETLGLLQPKQVEALFRLGVQTLGDVRGMPEGTLRRRLGSEGLRIERLAEGIDGDRVRPLWPPGRLSATMELELIDDRAELERALVRLCRRLEHRLKARTEFARCVGLTVSEEGDAAGIHTQKEELARQARGEKELFRTAVRLLDRMPLKNPVQRLELELTRLGPAEGGQLLLLDGSGRYDGTPSERDERMTAALKHLSRRFGAQSVAKMEMPPSRIQMWTTALGKRLHEDVQVLRNEHGEPRQVVRNRQRLEVCAVVDHWRETRELDAFETEVFRVHVHQLGLAELRCSEGLWQLSALAD